MEEKALETLRAILGRRGLPTTTVHTGDHTYTIGDRIVIFIPGNNPTKTALDKLLDEHSKNVILVTSLPPSESVRAHMRNYAADGVQLFNMVQLQFDIMTHKKYGFPCRIITPEQKGSLMQNMRITSFRQIPRIGYDDPYSLWVGAKPEDILEFEIPSDSAGWSKKYRYVVTNVEEV
jgi:DNA-directed RNA polymerase subunit H (RpoH/RPB5)